MKKITLSIALLLCTASFVQKKEVKTDPKKEQDRQAILSLAGCHTVTFDFTETFSSANNYKYHDRYHDEGTEYVQLIENTENKIVLQHLLIVTETMTIKHWRQDWVFENTELLQYDKGNHWTKISLKPDQVKGQWTQKVSQVDDSPRYEASATWVHVDGKHYWKSTADAPLPRREYTKRSDYNVLKRHNKIILSDNGGWLHEQDNQKIIRTNGKDSVLCLEKGLENYTNLPEAKCGSASAWWNINKEYWQNVRVVWQDLQKQNKDINLVKEKNEKKLYEALFALGDKQTKEKTPEKEGEKEIKEIIETYFEKN